MPSPTIPPDAPHSSLVAWPHADCPLGGQRGADNIVHRSWTGQDKPIERWRCQACGQEFSARRGTLMAGSTRPEEPVERLLTWQRGGVCDAGTADICGVDIKTVQRFQRVAAPHAQEHHEPGTRELQVDGGQLDELPSKRRGPRVAWRHTAIAMGRRFVRWVPWGPRTQERAAWLIAQVVARRCGLPVWLSDGWRASPAALLQVLGRLSQRRRRGTRGRPPKPRVVPPQALFSAQGGKGRDGAGKRLQVASRVGYGGPRRFIPEMAARGLRPSLQTAVMERWYGTLRGLCVPLRRRPRCGSVRQRRHHARVWRVVDRSNCVLPHKSLRQQGRPRPPAMAIGLAQHVWSDRDYLWYPVHPNPLGRQRMQPRVKERLVPALEAG